MGVTAAASIADALARHRRARRLSALAVAWGVRFTPDDRFRLTPRVAGQFPTPGAADVVVRDVVYGQEAGGTVRYVFTIEYTVGVVRTKRRRSAVGMVVDSATPGAADGPLVLAPPDLARVGKYEWLWERHGGGAGTASANPSS